MKYNICLVLFIFFINFQIQTATDTSVSMKKGKIISRVVCRNDIKQSYALYLPSNYSVDRKWPVLYLFEPGARAMIPMKLFRNAAEKYKYILICSNNSKNGPPEPISRAMKAVWNDSRERLSIDLKRVYAGGFSGGARVSSWFKYIIKNEIAGIIAFGAGLATTTKAEQILPADYFAAIGMADFNYGELTLLNKSLEKAGVFHRVLVFEGNHRWPPEKICTQAIDWMDTRAVKKGLKIKNNERIKTLFEKELSTARKFNSNKKVLQAYNGYIASEKLFDGLEDLSIIKSEKEKLENSRIFKNFIKNEKKRLKKESSLLKQFNKVYSIIRQVKFPDPYLKKQINRLPFNYLFKKIKKNSDIYSKSMALRILSAVMIDSRMYGYKYIREKDFIRSSVFLELAVKAGSSDPFLYYNLACLHALNGRKNKAVNTLGKAIKKGFNNITEINRNKDFDKIRNDRKFMEIVRKLKAVKAIGK